MIVPFLRFFASLGGYTMRLLLSMILWCALAAPALAAPTRTVFMEDLTWMEVRERISHGAGTVIIPIGGTEQNGPHMVIGKHNTIVRYTAGEIAKRVNALVAPVLAYVPEGRVEPPEGHMQFAGTLSVRPQTLAMVLEDAARSMKQHGFRLICFVGDHGGSQETQADVARRLSEEWQSQGVRVMQVSRYYADNGQEKMVQSLGIKVPNPEAHAGFMDTSELLAIDAPGVRTELLGVRGEHDYKTTGAMGDSSQASAAYGRRLISLKVEAAVDQIENGIGRTRR